MFIYPVTLPVFSNREDFYTLVGLNDDDTGDAIDLAGITLANVNGYTGNAWTVTLGTVTSTSSTSITIPGLPANGELSALALTIGAGLSVAAGSPVIITDTPTGLNSMIGFVTSYAATTGALVCQIGKTFQFEIRRSPAPQYDGYGPYYDCSVPNGYAPLITAALGTGLSIVDTGILQIRIPESTTRQLRAPETYMASLTMTDGVDTRQLFSGRLPIAYGGVTQ